MPKTTTDLVGEVLEELRVIGAGEVASAEDAEMVKRKYANSLVELEFLGIAAWPEASIPDAYFQPLAAYMAAVCAPALGREYMDVSAAHRRLRAVTAKPYTGATAELNYF